MTQAPPRLSVRDLAVVRGSTLALRSAELIVDRPGSVHALLGQNGSGKSTLLGVLAGQLKPMSGTVELDGAELPFGSFRTSRAAGVVMVSQELSLAPDLSVAENVLMGRGVPRKGGFLQWAAARRLASESLERLGLSIDPRSRTGDLPPDQRQLVEIARAISSDVKLLILDEPTSSLSQNEVDALFAVIRELSAAQVSTVLVSHRIPELYEICDSITVLRDGTTALAAPMSETTPSDLVTAMVGEAPARRRIDVRRAVPGSVSAAELIEAELEGCFSEIGLRVDAGEIVGLAGLSGSGRSDLVAALAGALPGLTGTLRVGGVPVRPGTPRKMLSRRIAYLPPDRKIQGLHLGMSVSDNLALSETRNAPRLASPRRRSERSAARRLVEQLGIKTPGIGSAVGALSGGNQQKVALGKCLVRQPALLLLDEPTRGVDIAARHDIHQQLRELSALGVGVMVSSGDNDELLDLCDRIIVLSHGRIAGELSGADRTEHAIALLAGGAPA